MMTARENGPDPTRPAQCFGTGLMWHVVLGTGTFEVLVDGAASDDATFTYAVLG